MNISKINIAKINASKDAAKIASGSGSVYGYGSTESQGRNINSGMKKKLASIYGHKNYNRFDIEG